MEVVDGVHAGQSQGGWTHAGRCRSTSRVRGDTLMMITPPSRCAAQGKVEPELVGLPENAITRDATRRLWFVVHAASWLHSMVLHGRECCGEGPAVVISCL